MSNLVKKKRQINVNTYVWKDKKNPWKGGSIQTKEETQTVMVSKTSTKK